MTSNPNIASVDTNEHYDSGAALNKFDSMKSPNSNSDLAAVVAQQNKSKDTSGTQQTKSGKTDEAKDQNKRKVQIFADSADKKPKKPKQRPLTAEEKILKQKTDGKL
jgi:hypothetical protein